MIMKLREYQEEAVRSSLNEFKNGISRQLIVLPTGSGKTVLFAALAKSLNVKTLVLAHRHELILQARSIFNLCWKTADIGICKAELNELAHQVVIGSVQSCVRRISQLKKERFQLLIIDEAHHAAASSYMKIIKELGFFDDKNKLLIGVTATPDRADNKELGDIFEKVVFSRSISTMIKAAYLSPVHGRKILTNMALTGIQAKNGDFITTQLSQAINTPARNSFIAEKYFKHANKRKGIIFCASVQHCHDIAEEFNQKGIPTKAIWGTMPTTDREHVLKDFKKSKIQAVSSCGILTEGFDEPSVNCIVMARPTKNKSLYTQSIGRGLRIFPTKNDCLVLDFADNYHDINSLISLKKTVPSADVVEKQKRSARGENERLTNVAIKEHCDECFDILGQTKFSWVLLGDNEFSLTDNFNNEIIIEPKMNGYIAQLHTRDEIIEIVKEPLPLDYCTGVCEDYARRFLELSYANLNGEWLKNSRHDKATQKQELFLKNHGIKTRNISKAEASLKIRKIIALLRKEERSNNCKRSALNQKFT